MKIRQATEKDLGRISEIDKKAYGDYGGSKEYFAKKLEAFPEGMLIAEDKGLITGFTVFEIVAEGKLPKDFKEIELTNRANKAFQRQLH